MSRSPSPVRWAYSRCSHRSATASTSEPALPLTHEWLRSPSILRIRRIFRPSNRSAQIDRVALATAGRVVGRAIVPWVSPKVERNPPRYRSRQHGKIERLHFAALSIRRLHFTFSTRSSAMIFRSQMSAQGIEQRINSPAFSEAAEGLEMIQQTWL